MSPRKPKAPAAAQAPELDLDLGTAYDRRSGARGDARHAASEAFDPVTVSLEPGVSLVEASAGTGKTFGITTTVIRLLLDRTADGAYRVQGIGSVLVVTFTRAATAELITRVRDALRAAVDVFAGVADETDEKLADLRRLREKYGHAEVERLRAALASLDQLSIFTIHGFCKRVLEESALESGTPFDAGFLEDDSMVLERAAQDWWRRTIYEDAQLAALAVHDGWRFDAFTRDSAREGCRNDFKAWQRLPEVRLDPGGSLEDARRDLDAAVAAFGTAWDATRAAAFLEERKWLGDSPLSDPFERRRVVIAGDRVARGDFAGVPRLASACTSEAMLHSKRGMHQRPAALRDAVAHEPWVLACDALAAALERMRLALRVSCLRAVAKGFEEEKRRRHLIGFDDLLRRLRDAIEREGEEGHLSRAIRRRWDAALIDEFQDTDPFQFPIFSRAFAGRPLFLIGDPKQAIYGFRGADVFAYLRAADTAARRYTLGRNWRSSTRMVSAVNALFERQPLPFVFDQIAFHPAVAEDRKADPLAGDHRAALHWWFVPPTEGKSGPTALAKTEAQSRLHAALTRETVRLLRPVERGGCGLRPGSIAVLVRTGHEGREIRQVLRAANVPAIVAGMGDVLASPEMAELETVLHAVLAPVDAAAVRAALATELWGMTAAGIHGLSQPEREADWQELAERLAAAREAWLRHGFMRMVQALLGQLGAVERLLAYEDGERRLTNLRHAVELLHGTAMDERLSPEGLLLWIAHARARGSADAERTELRLESDADAVQIVTIHKSKGLEYDVVFLPGLWAARRTSDAEPVLVHEGEHDVVFDHGSPKRPERGAVAERDRLAEDLRLAYVALTRARFRCYVGWGPVINSKSRDASWHSSLAWLLREQADVPLPPGDALAGDPAAWRGALEALVDGSGGAMSMEVLDASPAIEAWEGSEALALEPAVRRPLPVRAQLESWRIASFTSLTSGRHVEDARDTSDPASADAGAEPPRPPGRDDFMAFPAGRHAGVVLHELFEKADFADDAQVRALATQILVRERLASDASDPRVAATCAMAARVLGEALPGAGFALRDVPAARTLREWKFQLPMGAVERRTLADLFARHGGDLARRYAATLGTLAPERTWGFLTGVVDLALERDGRWYVVDWKSNHLGTAPDDYAAPALETEMFGSHYVLQYHLYLTALHRFLRVRLPGYDYERHVGGAWYAFLRGVDGSGRGWFHDRPPHSLIAALDALMDAGSPATGSGVA